MAESNSGVPFWWIVLFVLLALGAGALAVTTVGGSLVSSPEFLMPVFGL
ncbi:hypothetical protein [Halopelagius longus]|uniref:Uncharacterized protein n=1 Tax=Halopelagius longus TaxID=1236180 RepID=A0A1H1E2L5_9EURY|nr:hypothetical protein [Halopelagius longus]SDQ82937.1 hypothetical protein SAMN05216278_2704 [Halopelagius longus]